MYKVWCAAVDYSWELGISTPMSQQLSWLFKLNKSLREALRAPACGPLAVEGLVSPVTVKFVGYWTPKKLEQQVSDEKFPIKLYTEVRIYMSLLPISPVTSRWCRF
jgi:hypothetical protein